MSEQPDVNQVLAAVHAVLHRHGFIDIALNEGGDDAAAGVHTPTDEEREVAEELTAALRGKPIP